MNSGTAENQVKVVLDTNILISAVGFEGKPRTILFLVMQERVKGVISPILLIEFIEVISKKFPKIIPNLPSIEAGINESFLIVQPKKSINIARDEDDNRVLEAAVEGNCNFIITGDKDLLELGKYKKIKIITPAQFLDLYSNL